MRNFQQIQHNIDIVTRKLIINLSVLRPVQILNTYGSDDMTTNSWSVFSIHSLDWCEVVRNSHYKVAFKYVSYLEVVLQSRFQKLVLLKNWQINDTGESILLHLYSFSPNKYWNCDIFRLRANYRIWSIFDWSADQSIFRLMRFKNRALDGCVHLTPYSYVELSLSHDKRHLNYVCTKGLSGRSLIQITYLP